MSVWTLVAVAWVVMFAGCVIGWRLRGSVQSRGHGGMLDLTPPPDELDLDWRFPLVHTDRHAHPKSWCSRDYCGKPSALDELVDRAAA